MWKSSLSLGVCVFWWRIKLRRPVWLWWMYISMFILQYLWERERRGEREMCFWLDWRHWDTTREWEREREGTNAVYTLAQLPEITASPILPDWNRGEWNERMARTQKMKRTLHCILLGNDLWWINRNRRRGWEREGERGEGGGGESLASSEVAPVEPVHAAACMCVWESEWVHECWHVDL